MPAPPEARLLPNLDDHFCFGCSPINPKGLQMTFYALKDTVASWVVIDEHYSGWRHVVHGGIIASMLDEIMGRGGLYLLKRLVMTKSLTLDFLSPVGVGEELMVEGKVLERVDDRNAVMAGTLYNASGHAAARAQGQFKLFTVDALRRRGGMDDHNLVAIGKLLQSL